MAKKLKKIASIALPILGAVTGNPLLAAAGAAVGSKVGGGSWGDALKSGLIGGITGGIGSGLTGAAPTMTGIGFLDDIATGLNSGLAPIGAGIKSGLSGLTGGLSDMFSGLTGSSAMDPQSALDAAISAPSGGGGLSGLSPADQSFIGRATGAVTAPTSQATSGLGSILSDMTNKITSDPFGALGTALSIGNELQGGAVDGTQSQAQILAQMEADKASQQQFSQDTIRMLNAAQSGRAPMLPSIADYYTYGSGPEQTFFNKVNTPITYG